MRAQQQLEAVLSGAASYEDLSPALKSAISIHIYFRAAAIIDMTSHARQREAIDAEPESIRELVRKECRRLHNARNA